MAKNKLNDTGWIQQSLAEFFRGPLWTVPLMNFIESRSIIFESETNDVSADREEYRAVFSDYGRLVNSMLASFCQDVAIRQKEDLEAVCDHMMQMFHSAESQGRRSSKTAAVATALEQIQAAKNYALFCRMMVRTNIELQLQAIEMLRLQWGITTDLQSGGATHVSEYEQQVLQEVMKKSLQDHMKEEEMFVAEEVELKQALTASEQDRKRLEEEHTQEQELIREAMQLSLDKHDPTHERNEESNQEKESEARDGFKQKEDIEHPQETTARSQTPPGKSQQHEPDTESRKAISKEALSQRQVYLRQQRDKLMAIKQSQRRGMLDETNESLMKKRPKSSRAARNAVKDDIDAKTMEMRKQMADTLRREVVDKSNS